MASGARSVHEYMDPLMFAYLFVIYCIFVDYVCAHVLKLFVFVLYMHFLKYIIERERTKHCDIG
jgi:hypothetical protein